MGGSQPESADDGAADVLNQECKAFRVEYVLQPGSHLVEVALTKADLTWPYLLSLDMVCGLAPMVPLSAAFMNMFCALEQLTVCRKGGYSMIE
eukprot:scaffold94671_cov40-Prasinocladus_malaysianus.AAC.2